MAGMILGFRRIQTEGALLALLILLNLMSISAVLYWSDLRFRLGIDLLLGCFAGSAYTKFFQRNSSVATYPDATINKVSLEGLAYTCSRVSVGDVPALRVNHCIPHRVVDLPFADCSFDVVTANMVLEHAGNPAALLSEVWRILRPRGVFLFHTPNRYSPQSVLASLLPERIKSRLTKLATNRSERDVYPTFYRINTESVTSDQSEAAGFRMKDVEVLETPTYPRHRRARFANLTVAWLLRRKMLGRLPADSLVMLCKPDVECACCRLERPWQAAA
jgi:SAM-dependent methyltransferase